MAKASQPLWTVVGKKLVMAVTGLLLCLFLVGHLAGNTLLLAGANNQFRVFNAYANFLDALPILPIVEILLLAIFLMHAYDGLVLTLENRRARAQGYELKVWARAKSPNSRKSASSSTMMWTGTVILLFVALHVYHFKYNHPLGAAPPDSVAAGSIGSDMAIANQPASTAPQAARDLASLVVWEFHKPAIVALYVFAMVVLGIHLFHAVSSSLQSLGIGDAKWGNAIIWFGRAFTIVIAGGLLLLPIWTYFCTTVPGGSQ